MIYTGLSSIGLGSLFGGGTDIREEAGLKVNLQDILEKSIGIFEPEGFSRGNPFGLSGFYLEESPSFSDFNNLFNRRPSVPEKTPTKDVGEFAGLRGDPWTNFLSMFALYRQPEHEGYNKIFGPVGIEDKGCGLCHLFPQFSQGDFVTLELGQQPVETVSTDSQELEVEYY